MVTLLVKNIVILLLKYLLTCDHFLLILVPLQLFLIGSTVYFKYYGADHSFAFTCETAGTYWWHLSVKFKGDVLDSDKYTLENDELTIKNIKQEDEGEYECGDQSVKLEKGML